MDEDHEKADLRQVLANAGIHGASSAVLDRSQAELMQLTLLARDEAIVRSLDKLVGRQVVSVPGEEIRRPIINAGAGSGHYGLRPELSADGVRFVARFEDLAPLRLKRLVRRLYPTRESGDIIEFDWQLRGTDAITAEGKLEQFIRSNTPEQVVKRLVLASKANVITTGVELAIDTDDYDTDDAFVRRVLWKLGYPAQSSEDFNQRFWRLHDEMSRLSQTAGVSAVVDESAVRSLASNYFVELEGVLDDSLAFITWLLLMEHMSDTEPFTYHIERDRLEAFRLLSQISLSHTSTQEVITFSEQNQLHPLCRGFAVLADHLKSLVAEERSHRRPESELPVGVHGSDLKTYPFFHYEVYLDLTKDAQTAIVDLLHEVSRRLLSADVPHIRNSWQHYRRSTVAIEPLISCLQSVASVISSLEGAGLCRIMYSHTGLSFDAWGRGFFRFQDRRGREISLATPSTLDLGALPSPTMPQYLATIALLSGSGDFVRCKREEPSEFSRVWSGYPTRRHEGKTKETGEGEQLPEGDVDVEI